MQLIDQKKLHEMAKILGGLPVLMVFPNSPAKEQGISYGDIILSVNGHPTPNYEEYAVARKLRQDGMSCVVFRAGHELSFDMQFE